MILELSTFDPQPFAVILARAADSTVFTFADVADRSETPYQLYKLNRRLGDSRQ